MVSVETAQRHDLEYGQQFTAALNELELAKAELATVQQSQPEFAGKKQALDQAEARVADFRKIFDSEDGGPAVARAGRGPTLAAVRATTGVRIASRATHHVHQRAVV